MFGENGRITQFSPEFMSGNIHAMCFSDFGVFAVSCGACVHFYKISPSKSIEKLYTITPTQSVVTALKFHPIHKQIIIGDGVGKIQIFDFITKKIIANSTALKDPVPICDFVLYQNIIVAIRGNRSLCCYSLIPDEKSVINEYWSIPLPILFTRMDINDEGILLLFGHEYHFMIIEEITKDAPLNLPPVLQSQEIIKDAQFHYHLPGYIYIITESNVRLYHVKTQRLVSLIMTSMTASPFEGIVQFRSTHRVIWIRHFNGTIAKYNIHDPLCFTVDKNATTLQIKQRLFGIIADPMNDSRAVLFYHPFGVCLMDAEKFIITSCGPMFTSHNTCIDIDKSYYALGQSHGIVVTGNINNSKEMLNFQVSKKDITFVSVARPIIYWATETEVGEINVNTRHTRVFKTNNAPIKITGSHHGGLLVQRRPDILGVFIDGSEKSIAFNSNIVSFCLHAEDSSRSTGKFIVLTESRDIYFIRYDGNQVDAPFLQLHAVEQMGTIISIAWSGNTFATGATNGVITTIDITNPSPQFTHIFTQPVTYLSYCNNTIIGMYSNTTIIFGLEGRKAGGTFQQIVPVSENEFAYILPNGHVRFVRTDTFETLQDLNKNENGVFSDENGTQLGLTVKDIIEEKENLYAMYKACSTKDSILVNKIISYLDEQEAIDKWELACALSFSNQKEKAIEVLSTVEPEDPKSLFCTMLISTVLGIDKKPNEKQMDFIKERTTKMIENGNYIDAICILTLCNMNSYAIEELIEKTQYELALSMIRKLEPCDKKNKFLFRIACDYMTRGKREEAILCFASAKEYHALLFALYSSGLIQDSKNIKKLLESKEKIAPILEENEKIIGSITPLDELLKLIEGEC